LAVQSIPGLRRLTQHNAPVKAPGNRVNVIVIVNVNVIVIVNVNVTATATGL
jgi:hypothetical protein